MDICSVILRGAVRQTDKPFTYLIPDELKGKVTRGSFVRVPFGKANKINSAVVVDVRSEDVDIAKMKAVDSLISDLPVMNEDQLELIDMIAMRFNCTRGDAIELMVPSCVEQHKEPEATFVTLSDRQQAIDVLTSDLLRSKAHINILEFLLKSPDTEKSMLLASLGVSPSQLKAVIDKGLVVTYKKRVDEIGEDKALIDRDNLDSKFSMTFDLNNEQKDAVNTISGNTDPNVYLLFGITGSGKTEVYLNCAQECLNKGGNVLYLVPEISLTPQTINWIAGRLGDSVAVLHSRLTSRQRYEQWDRIRKGKARVVVAPRSGIFAPIRNLKLIIIDEEHDPSYKSETHPRYSTKDIARMRQKLTGAKIVLGSATPSVESFYAAKKNIYKLITLKERAHGEAKLPEIIPVDMKEQLKLGAGEMLSVPLRQAMARAFSQKKQVMLFLNRRGYSRTLVCGDCGQSVSCKNCSVPMTLHNNRRTGGRNLICHYCGYTIPASLAKCECGSVNFTRAGFGTQQLEELLQTLYPCEKVLRMDQDTTMSPDAHNEIITKFARKEASILIGTQMIAKGLDFPDVTVVGILGADLMLMSSNYMASERAFQLITQAAGRAGRGDCPGEVYIQSFRPELPLFKYALTQDYESFFDSEIEYRSKVKLPPFKAIGELVVSSTDEDDAKAKADALSEYLRQFLSVQDSKYDFELFGPIPDVLYELRGRYRMDIVIKASNKSALNAVFRQVNIDFDPKVYQIAVNNDASS